ncbi:MAG: hypothetical protein VB050_18220 [Geobacteraceae bacterium]|nr:hypothetical protein [Geobacteraceae bacterium]
MGCHLHDLIEAVQQKRLMCLDIISDEDFREILHAFRNAAPRSICFDMGDIDEFPSITPVSELVKAPFSDCWFECNFKHTDGTQIILGMLVVISERVQITSFRRKHNQWLVRGVIFTDTLSSRNFQVYPAIDIVAEELKQHKLVLSTFLSALNCRNVKQVEHKPESKLQKVRQKRGKQSLFSSWTLELAIPKMSTENEKLNGTHASPRVHLRRGHPRQYAPEKWTWVQPCMVGTHKGIVSKDYLAKYDGAEKSE